MDTPQCYKLQYIISIIQRVINMGAVFFVFLQLLLETGRYMTLYTSPLPESNNISKSESKYKPFCDFLVIALMIISMCFLPVPIHLIFIYLNLIINYFVFFVGYY